MVDIKFKPKPKPDFDYTSVPFEPKNKYFYPDRIFRDEISARNQWFQDKDFQLSNWGRDLKQIQNAIDAGKSPARNYGLAQDMMVKRRNDLELKNTPRWNPKTKKYDGPMERPGGNYDFEPADFSYLEGLHNVRQKQFQKYNPYYGMSKRQIQEMQPRKSWMHGYEYGEGDPKEGLGYWQDFGLGALRSGLGDVAWLQDAITKGVSQTFWPVDEESMTGGMLPRGWKDLAEYTSLMGMFDQSGLGVTEDEWNELGYSEKKDLNESFQEMTKSPWDYDPTYHPLTEPGGFKEMIEEFSEDYLTPSSDYLETAWEIPNPLAFQTAEDKNITYTDMNAAELTGSIIAGGGLISLIRKLGKKFGPLIPAILKNHPYLLGGGAGTAAYTAGEYFED